MLLLQQNCVSVTGHSVLQNIQTPENDYLMYFESFKVVKRAIFLLTAR